MGENDSILMVKIEPELQEALTELFRVDQIGAAAVTTLSDALEATSAGKLRGVIIAESHDLHETLELIRKIRQASPEAFIMLLVSPGLTGLANEAYTEGANDVMVKPGEAELVVSRVKQLLAEQDQLKKERGIIWEVNRLLDQLQESYDQDSLAGGDSASTPETVPLRAGSIDRSLEKNHSFSEERYFSENRYLRAGQFVLDLHARQVLLNNRIVSMPASVFDYFAILARHAPMPVSYESLAMEAQNYEPDPQEARELARWRMYQLRKALEPNPDKPVYVLNVRSFGYRLEV